MWLTLPHYSNPLRDIEPSFAGFSVLCWVFCISVIVFELQSSQVLVLVRRTRTRIEAEEGGGEERIRSKCTAL